jgi:hypothetical protein
MAVTWKKLAYEEDVVLKSLFNAHTVLAAVDDNVPAAVTVGEQTVVGRLTGGNIAALTAANLRAIANVEDGADVTDADNVAAAGAIMETDIDALGDLIVGAGANTAGILPVGTEGQILKVGANSVLGWAADEGDVAFPETANATTMAAIDPVLGKGCFRVDELAPYVCTVIA